MKIVTMNRGEFEQQYGAGRPALAEAPLIGSVNGKPCPATPDVDIRVVTALADTLRVHRVLEIGCNTGATAAAILAGNTDIEYYGGLDLPKIWFTNMPAGHFALKDERFHLIQHEGGSRKLDIAVHNNFDLIFIDGAHEYESVRLDTLLARQIRRENGVIVWHDCHHPQNPAVLRWLTADPEPGTVFHVEGTWMAFELHTGDCRGEICST